MQKLKLYSSLMAMLVLFFAGTTPSGYQVGDTVANFKLKNTDGKFVSLTDYQSKKGVIVIFDCNTCPYSKAYNERILALDKKYASKNIPVVVINSNDATISPGDSFDNMVKQAKDKKYSFPYLTDESQEVARNFGATNTPHVFVLAKHGNDFKVAYIGAIDNNTKDAKAADKKYVEDAVDAILTGSDISTNKTKAIGCTIKWKKD